MLLLDSDIVWLRCVAMNLGLVIVESKDFTSIQLRMSYTMSFRRLLGQQQHLFFHYRTRSSDCRFGFFVKRERRKDIYFQKELYTLYSILILTKTKFQFCNPSPLIIATHPSMMIASTHFVANSPIKPIPK